MAGLLKEDVEAPLCLQMRWSDWIDRPLPRHGAYWKKVGIYDAILLSRNSVNRDENLLAAALCFWNSTSNIFDFRLGPMSPTLLDLAQIFGFSPHGRPADAVDDYHRGKNRERLAKPFTIPAATINQNCSFYTKALHNHADVGLGPIVLAHLYKNLHSATLESTLNISAHGALWMIQIWLQVYFPELRFLDIVLPEDQVMTAPLMSIEVPKRSIEEYLMFLRPCTKRSVAQWQVVLRRSYPWFQPGHRLFEKEPEEEEAKIDFRKKKNSECDAAPGHTLWWRETSQLSSGGKSDHPNFCAKQLGCPQLIPLKSYRSYNCATSWKDLDDLDVHKDYRCSVNKINNSVDALYPSWEPKSCSSGEFDAWWKALFAGLPDASTAMKTLFETWDAGIILVEPKAKKFIVQMVKGINAQVIEDPSMTSNLGSQSVVFFKLVSLLDSESSSSPSKVKKLGKKAVNELDEKEEHAAVLVEPQKLMKSYERPIRPWNRRRRRRFWKEKKKRKRMEKKKWVEEGRTTVMLAIVTSPLKPPIVAMPIHSVLGSPATASFADRELVEFEAMDLDAQLDRLEQLSSTPGKAKSKAVDGAVDRVKIWQSTKLDLDENKEAIDQLMQDLDLLHRQNVVPMPILEISLGLARDVLNLHNCYEDLQPSFKAFEFYKATHEANLADYQKQKAELDMMVADYKETKIATDKLEKHIEELHKQLASLRGKQNKLRARLGTNTKATFLVQNIVAASRPASEIAEASLHQGMLLPQEISTKKDGF
ncbi:unnamed protein product [Prunus armeniaca]